MKKLTALLIVFMLTFTLMVTASAATVLKGDVDMNGKITAMDARTVLRAAARLDEITDTQKIIADVSGDSKVTASDARTILRRAANIEKDLGTVEIEDASGNPDTTETTKPDETEATTAPPVERTELSTGISMNYRSFMDKFGAMRKVGRTDNIIEYTNDKMTIISDPYMIYTGNVSSIIITGGDYTLNGVYAGMSKADALSTLKADKWTVREEDSSSVRLTRNAMVMMLTLSDDVVVKAEYTFAESLLPPEERPTETTTEKEETTTKLEPSTEETTTKIEPSTDETTTKVEPSTDETTTKVEPSTEETTTKNEEPTTLPSPGGNIEYEDLPSQIKSFLEGHFGIIGFNYSQGKKNAVTMYITPTDVKAGMGLDTGNGTLSLDIVIKDVTGKSDTYIVIPGEKKYCELTPLAMSILGIKPEELKIDFGTASGDYKAIVRTNEKSAGVDYVVYTIDTGKEYCKVFTINDEIKRIETYSSTDGVMKSRIDVTTFITEVSPSEFSLDGYKKKSFMELFGSLLT